MAASAPLRVLLVEDDAVIAQAVQALLRAGPNHGGRDPPPQTLSVSTASTLSEALTLLGHEAFDAILLDLNLTDSTGSNTYERILRVAKDAAVVVFTGTDDEELALAALRAGAQDYILKGATSRDVLVRALRHAVQRKAATRQASRGDPPGGSTARRQLDLAHAEQEIIRWMESGARRASPRFEPGELMAERYRLREALGRGSFGVTFLAEDEVLRRPRVVKALIAREDGEASARAFLSEARKAAAVESPHVVRIDDFGIAGRTPYIVMEFVKGRTLAARLAEPPPLTARETAAMAADVLEGLADVHACGILHRDLKPSNIMLSDAGAKIIDFGLARRIKDPTVSSLAPPPPGEGTLGYMSPEALVGDVLTPASDIYAMGAVLFECIAGRSYLPQAPRAEVERAILDEAPRLPPEADPALGAIALRALAKAPAGRYATADQMREAILALGLD